VPGSINFFTVENEGIQKGKSGNGAALFSCKQIHFITYIINTR